MIRMALLILILILSFTFMIKNIDQMVVVDYFMGITTPPIPVYQLVGGALILGMALAGIFIFPEWLRLRLEVRRQKKTLRRLEQELDDIRSLNPDEEPTEDEMVDDTARER